MEKIKVAFYLPNKGYTSVDFSNYRYGNPGIGGSEYAVILVADELARNSHKLDISLFVDKKSNNLECFSSNLSVIEVDSYKNTIENLRKNKIEYFIYCYGYFDNKEFWDYLDDNIKVIIWCGCFLPWKKLLAYTKNKHIIRLVAVGQEQLDLYRDHSAYEKSDFIYNPIPQEQIDNARKKGYLKRIDYSVTYMGSLTPPKSFDVLAKAWPYVLKEVPNAKLNVIGGGNLYNRNTKLGKWGLAEENFENRFMKFLINKKGEIIPSVKFWGVLGDEKNEILRNTRVGIPNPRGSSETYGFVAVEMQLGGALITTQECPGFIDTVVSKQAILYKSPRELAKSIVKLLKEENTSYYDTIDTIDQKFNLSTISKEWEYLITDCIPNGKFVHEHVKLTNSSYAHKRLRELFRRINLILPSFLRLPSVFFIECCLFKLNLKKPSYLV